MGYMTFMYELKTLHRTLARASVAFHKKQAPMNY